MNKMNHQAELLSERTGTPDPVLYLDIYSGSLDLNIDGWMDGWTTVNEHGTSHPDEPSAGRPLLPCDAAL